MLDGMDVATIAERGENGNGRASQSLEARAADAEALCIELAGRCERAERLALDLVELYAACYRLHGSMDREEIFSLIARLASSPIGAEAMGVYRLEHGTSRLRLMTHLGIDPDTYASLGIESGPIARAVLSGETFYADDDQDPTADPGAPVACAPIILGGKVIGAIVIFRLRDGKSSFESIDRELIALLSARAGLALYCAGMHQALVSRR